MSAPAPGGKDVAAPARAVPEELRRAAALVFVEDLEAPALGAEDTHHLLDVLRLRPGERLACSDGAGRWRLAELAPRDGAGRDDRTSQAPDGPLPRPDRSQLRNARPDPRPRPAPPLLLPCSEIATVAPPERKVGVGFALMKGDRPEWTVQKLTELGVDELHPFLAERSVVRPHREAGERRLERLRRVAREAAAQSRRLHLPVLHELVPLQQLLARLAPLGAAVALAEPGGEPLGPEVSHLLVGPEGGFSAGELTLCERSVEIAPLVLRAETAAVAAGCLLATIRDGLCSGVDRVDRAPSCR